MDDSLTRCIRTFKSVSFFEFVCSKCRFYLSLRSLFLFFIHAHFISHPSFLIYSLFLYVLPVGIEFTAWMSSSPWPIGGHYTFFTSFYVYVYVFVYSSRKYSDSKGKSAQKGDQHVSNVSNIYRYMTKWLIQMKMSIYVRTDACVCVCVYFDMKNKCWSDLCRSFVWIIISRCLTTQPNPFWWSV